MADNSGKYSANERTSGIEASSYQTTNAPDVSTGRFATLQGLVVAAIVVAGLHFGRDLLLPLALAILLSFVLTPPIVWLRRLHLPRPFAVSVVVVIAFSVICGVGWLLSNEATKMAAELPAYRLTLSQKIDSLRGGLSESNTLKRASELLADLGERFQEPLPHHKASVEDMLDAAGRAEPKPIPVEIREPDLRGFALLTSIAGSLLPSLITTGIVLVLVVFILLQREDLRDRLIRLFGGSDLQRVTAAMADAASSLSSFFSRLVLINACYGLTIGASLWVIGIPSATVWGILAMLMRFVPYVGSYLAAALPALIAFAIDPGWGMLVAVVVLFVVGEFTMGQIVEPAVFGSGTGVTPIAVVASTIFWAWLWGPVGLLIAMPVTLCLVVLGRHVEGLHFLAVLLGDRSPLTPEETFYHRALAGDAAELTYGAELALKDQGLESYLGTVALGALKLAKRDGNAGTLDAQQTERIGKTINELVTNLSDFESLDWFRGLLNRNEGDARKDGRGLIAGQTAPVRTVDHSSLAPGWDGATPVLCIGGRSVLDESAAHIFAEVLRQRGLNATVQTHDALSVKGAHTISDTSAKLVALSYLGSSSSLVEIRYAVRRLRRVLPGETIILVTHWLASPGLNEAQAVDATGADAYASALVDSVDFCVDAAHGKLPHDEQATAAVGDIKR